MNTRNHLAILAFAASAVLLAGCSGGSGEPVTSEESQVTDTTSEATGAAEGGATAEPAPETSEGGAGNSTGIVVKYGGTDVSDLDWQIACLGDLASGSAKKDGVDIGFAVYNDNGKPSLASVAVGLESNVDEGVSFVDGTLGSVTTYSFDGQGEVVFVGTGHGSGSMNGTDLPLEIRVNCGG